MNSFQKVVKCCAMLFAGFLAVSIIGGILSAIVGGLGCLMPDNNSGVSQGSRSVSEAALNSQGEYSGIDNLKLDIGIYKVVIAEKDSINGIQVNTSDQYDDISITTNGDTLKVETEDEHWFTQWLDSGSDKTKGTVYIYIPSGTVLDKLYIDSGVGNVDISDIVMKNLNVDCGVGSVSCNNVQAEKADIEGGVGSIELEDVSLGGLELECGVGSIDVSGELTGKTSVEGGMGSVSMKLEGSKEDYNIKSESGVGGIYINNEKVGNVNYYSEGKDNTLDLEGGVGSINVSFHS